MAGGITHHLRNGRREQCIWVGRFVSGNTFWMLSNKSKYWSYNSSYSFFLCSPFFILYKIKAYLLLNCFLLKISPWGLRGEKISVKFLTIRRQRIKTLKQRWKEKQVNKGSAPFPSSNQYTESGSLNTACWLSRLTLNTFSFTWKILPSRIISSKTDDEVPQSRIYSLVGCFKQTSIRK